MTRTNLAARSAGTRFERLIADYLAAHVDDRIDRRARNGAKDRGDIGGLCTAHGRIVVECKDTTRIELAKWAVEAEAERGNDDALVGLVAHKRHGVADPGRQWITCTVVDLIALITGERPEDVA
ncbi:MAG: hypothetical protein ACRDMV_05740 [Streptosporangiales bacterium]